MKRVLTFFSSILFATGAIAQSSDEVIKSFRHDPFNDPMLPVYLVVGIVVIAMVLVGFVAIYLIRILNEFTRLAEKHQADKLGVAYAPKGSWWSRFSQQMNASVPLENEKEIELDHSYDGIKELDNHLPPWWKWLFYGTIGWSAVYIVIFHVLDTLPLQQQEYEHELALAREQAKQYQAAQPQASIDENSLTFSADQEIITKGKSVFSSNNCGGCHRNDGGGNTIGPNLTDEFWIHGGDIKQVYKTIKDGVVEKGMPAWGKAMSPQDVRDVSFYIMSLQGTNPPNAKGPQGEQVKQVVVVSDSTRTRASL